MKIIGKSNVPVGAINDTMELLEDPEFEKSGLMQTLDHPELGKLKMVGWPVKHNGSFAKIKPAPLKGEHKEAVLSEWLGLNGNEVNNLKKEGII